MIIIDAIVTCPFNKNDFLLEHYNSLGLLLVGDAENGSLTDQMDDLKNTFVVGNRYRITVELLEG